MICKQCGKEYPDGGRFCPSCGTPSAQPEPQRADTYPLEPRTRQPAEQRHQASEQTYQQPYPPTAQNIYYTQQPARTDPDAFFREHPEYRSPGAWGFFGLSILYSIPIVGFIFLIVHSCSGGNLVRRNYARSFWCGLIIAAVIMLIVLIIALASGVGIAGLMSSY